MQVSKQIVNRNLQKEILEMYFQLLADIKDPEEAKTFSLDVLGKDESWAIAKRLAVAYYLVNNRSYTNIKDNLKVSSATIATVDKERGRKGYFLALKRIQADKWASEWSSKIQSLFKKK
jgi:uncharacterized protein YerC